MEFDENLNPISPNNEPEWSKFSPDNFNSNPQPIEKSEPTPAAAPTPPPTKTPPMPAPIKLASEPITKKSTTPNTNLVVFIVSLALMAVIAITAMLVGWQPASASTPLGSERGLIVSGTGEAFMTPDVAKITFAVRTETKDIANSQKNNSEIISKVKTSLIGFSIDPNDIKTVQYNINPEYDYYPVSKPRLRGYSTYHSLLLTIRKLDDTDAIIQALSLAGATEISQVNFTVDDPSEVQNEARERAIQSAKDKASQIANLSDAQLGKIISITESSPETNSPQAMSGFGGGGGGLEPGFAAITSTITLTYTLK
ncbi:SIMPL domain-containing protein [Patescibacteria group bacterium]|nr:SIMPL domain-containing protein [Patescibacteria group bacterium]